MSISQFDHEYRGGAELDDLVESIIFVLIPPYNSTTSIVKYWNGLNWIETSLTRWDGTNFVDVVFQLYDGTAFIHI